MTILMRLSLCTNIVVLVLVGGSLLRRAPWVDQAYGPPSAARAILLAVYLAILVASAGLLYRPVVPAVATVLVLQVTYKLLTPLLVGTVRHPVVASNLMIAALHLVTVGSIWTAGRASA